MASTEQKMEHYAEQFAELSQRRELEWLLPQRQQAFELFQQAGFPTTRDEEWRYTSVTPIARTEFRTLPPASVELKELAPYLFPEAAAARLVFVNGVFAPALSALAELSGSVKAANFATANGLDSALRQHLGRYAPGTQAFVALNTALTRDGAVLQVARGAVIEHPVQVMFVTVPGAEPAMTHPRLLVVAGRDSQATVLETHVAMGEGIYFTNAVTELVVGENARIDHVKIQQENESAYHVATIQAFQERNSRAHLHSISLGAALARNDVNVTLAGEGCETLLNGLYQVAGQQHVDHHTLVDHAKPHCSSREYYKGVLDGHATGVFNGTIQVRKDAQKTDAIQNNKNLLLSEDAVINTKPQLLIFADDVRCTHGATIGQLDADAIFYLRARGIGLEAARHLLIRAFANDILGRIPVESVRQRLEQTLLERLSRGWKAEEVL
jgi:Fe-S cluster assembly protein SufD